MTVRTLRVAVSLAGVLLLAPFPSADAQPDEPVVYVIGDVAKPGPYPYLEDQTVGQVIESAGGLHLGEGASREARLALRAFLLRSIDAKVTSCLATPDTPTQPGDTIIVNGPGRGGPRLCDP
jgi:protein involved in polysaccharide export with SLBB domain